jgi:hypothetical protein
MTIWAIIRTHRLNLYSYRKINIFVRRRLNKNNERTQESFQKNCYSKTKRAQESFNQDRKQKDLGILLARIIWITGQYLST